MSDIDSAGGTDRKHPENAGILQSARDDSERYDVHTPHGSVMSVPATSAELALELAADEYAEHEPDDFDLVTDYCDHDRPMASGCSRCGRGWSGRDE